MNDAKQAIQEEMPPIDVESTSQAMTVRHAVGAIEQVQPVQTPTKTSQQMRVVEVSEALLPAYQKASTLELSDAEVEALMAPFPDDVVECRPNDGLLYIPHIHVSDRLNRIFKPGKWALIRRREWFDGGTMFAEYVLVIRGCYVGESIGGHPYVKSNPKTNYSDVLESTAAEALRRICGKRLSCGSQVWNPEYCRQWEANHRTFGAGKYGKRRPEAPTQPAPTTPKPSTVKPSVLAAEAKQTFVPVCTVEMVHESHGNRTDGTPWTAYHVLLNDGVGQIEVGTFSKTVAGMAKTLADTHEQCEVTYKPGKKPGTFEIVSLIPKDQPPTDVPTP